MIGRVFLKHLKINVDGVRVWFFIEVTVLVPFCCSFSLLRCNTDVVFKGYTFNVKSC
jgi:hypothetical protein